MHIDTYILTIRTFVWCLHQNFATHFLWFCCWCCFFSLRLFVFMILHAFTQQKLYCALALFLALSLYIYTHIFVNSIANKRFWVKLVSKTLLLLVFFFFLNKNFTHTKNDCHRNENKNFLGISMSCDSNIAPRNKL